jgi:hypothetical protein
VVFAAGVSDQLGGLAEELSFGGGQGQGIPGLLDHLPGTSGAGSVAALAGAPILDQEAIIQACDAAVGVETGASKAS